ncbi:MAG TPA: fasciclin domain-containing protein [Thermohalobaculum sp.]|nr:fasciclin domain-containing protein [Thermohalobaculum sp.]
MFRPILIASALALAACTTPMDDDEMAEAPAEETMNVVQTAQASDNLTTFVSAIEAAGFVDTLSGPGPFTVFAPTDAAFAALPENVLSQLLLPENRERLRVLLAYHVIPGAVMSADIAGQQVSAPTAMGASLQIDATEGVMVDNANVIAADIEATNGVIHVIDRVLVPQVQPSS